MQWMIQHDVKDDKLFLIAIEGEIIEKYQVSAKELADLYIKIGTFLKVLG